MQASGKIFANYVLRAAPVATSSQQQVQVKLLANSIRLTKSDLMYTAADKRTIWRHRCIR